MLQIMQTAKVFKQVTVSRIYVSVEVILCTDTIQSE
jgi:hypothetical protein